MTTTPIYNALVVEQAGRQAREYVRANLLACPTCKAPVGTPCRTATGNTATTPHRGRWLA